jgi:hypothetical protein
MRLPSFSLGHSKADATPVAAMRDRKCGFLDRKPGLYSGHFVDCRLNTVDDIGSIIRCQSGVLDHSLICAGFVRVQGPREPDQHVGQRCAAVYVDNRANHRTGSQPAESAVYQLGAARLDQQETPGN